MHIVKDSFDKANDAYDKAFAINNKPFSKDLYNASICASKISDHSRTSELVKRLMKLGCEPQFFTNNTIYDDFIKSKSWQSRVNDYPKLRSTYRNIVDHELRAKIQSLLERDQFWRNKDPLYSILKDSTFREDEMIMQEIFELFEHGYPSEYDIGLFFSSNGDAITYFSHLSIILLHNYVSNDNYKVGYDLSDQLRGFVERGEMHHGLFAFLYDKSGQYKTNSGYGTTMYYKVRGKYYTNQPSEQTLRIKNDNRAKIGLDNLINTEEKLKYELLHDEFDFFTGWKYVSVDLPTEVLDKAFREIEIKGYID